MQEVHDAVVAAASEGQDQLAASVEAGTAQLAADIETQQEQVEQTGQEEVAKVEASFAQAGQDITGKVGAARSALQAAGAQEQARLDAWLGDASSRAADGFAQRQERARQVGTNTGEGAVDAADEIAERTGGEISGYADQARATGERRAASPGGAPDAAEARAAAARKMGEDTAADITRSLNDAVKQLRGVGPETRTQFVQQATDLAAQLGQQLPTIMAALAATKQDASGHLQQTVSAGSSSLTQLETQVGSQLNTLQAQVTQALREQVDQSKASLGAAGQQAVQGFNTSHAQAAQAGVQLVASVLASIGRRPMRRARASQLASQLAAAVAAGFAQSEQTVEGALGEASQGFSVSADQILAAIEEAAAQASNAATQASEAAGQQADGQGRQLVEQLAQLVTGAIASGDAVTNGAMSSLDQTLSDVEVRFSQALGDFRIKLGQQGDQESSHVREPLASLDSRIDQAMAKAEEESHKSWLERAISAVPWGTILGILAALAVTVLVIALIGTGIGAFILAGALAGAVSVMVSTVTDNAIAGRPTDWGQLGKQMLIGAAFGAVGGAIGGGVMAGLGQAVAGGVLSQAGAIAIGKAANVVVGVGLGVVQNLIMGRPWHEGLLLNLGVSLAMSYGPGGEFVESITESARATAVDQGVAFNVTPEELPTPAAGGPQAGPDVAPATDAPALVEEPASERPTTADGRDVIAEASAPEGAGDHDVNAAADGECEICSKPCGKAEDKFPNAMKDPEAQAKMEAAESLSDPEARADAVADQIPDLEAAEAAGGTPEQGESAPGTPDQGEPPTGAKDPAALRSELDQLQDRAAESLEGHPQADDVAQMVQRAEELLGDPSRAAEAAEAIEQLRATVDALEDTPARGTDPSVTEGAGETRFGERTPWEPPEGAAPKPDPSAPPEARLEWLKERLQMHVDEAVQRYETEGLTPNQEAAVQADPSAEPRFRGSRIDEFAKATVLQDPDLAEVISAPDFVPEPDFIDSILPDWFDATTRRSWGAHLIRYAQTHGTQGHLLPTGPR